MTFGMVGLLHEAGERLDLMGHAIGDVLGCGGGFGGVLLNFLPLAGGLLDLAGYGLDISDLRYGIDEIGRLCALKIGVKLFGKRDETAPSTGRDGREDDRALPEFQRMFAGVADVAGDPKKECVCHEEWQSTDSRCG